MKALLKKSLAVLLIAVVALSAVACGSSKGTKTKDGDKTLFTYDGTDVPLKEAYIYAKMLATNYEATYSSYFGADFWSMSITTDEDGNNVTFEDSVKEQAITQIKQIVVLVNKAEELKLSLTDDEKEECKKYAEAFAEDATGKAILEECGADVETMQKIYEDNKLASKVQQDMVKDTDTNVSDKEARTTKISRIVFETTTTDEQGATQEMTDAEKKKVMKKAKAALKKAKAGTSIADIAAEQEYTNVEETFTKGESEEGKAFEKKVAKMKDGELYDGVLECDNGYVVFQLDAYTDKDATAETKQSIIEERQQKTFSEKYTEWTEDLEKDWDYKKDVDQELWAQVILHSEESTATEAQEETTAAAEEATTEVATETTTEATK